MPDNGKSAHIRASCSSSGQEAAFAWIKCGIRGRDLPAEWDEISPTLVQDGHHWNLHTAVQKQFSTPGKVETILRTNSETRMCSVDLNITKHLAVCSILTVEGTVVATRFIKGGKQLHGRRREAVGKDCTKPKQDRHDRRR